MLLPVISVLIALLERFVSAAFPPVTFIVPLTVRVVPSHVNFLSLDDVPIQRSLCEFIPIVCVPPLYIFNGVLNSLNPFVASTVAPTKPVVGVRTRLFPTAIP